MTPSMFYILGKAYKWLHLPPPQLINGFIYSTSAYECSDLLPHQCPECKVVGYIKSNKRYENTQSLGKELYS